MAPHFVLESLNLEFEAILLDRRSNAHKSAEYLALNPSGKIPTLVNKTLVITESAAICLYLAEQHPQSNLVPPVSAPERALCYQWLMFLTNTLQAEIMIAEYPSRYVEPEKESHLIANQGKRIEALLIQIDKQLANNKYLIGEQLSICDYYLFMLAIWADEQKSPPLSFQHFSRYLKEMAQQEAVIKVCHKEGFSLADYQ